MDCLRMYGITFCGIIFRGLTLLSSSQQCGQMEMGLCTSVMEVRYSACLA